MKRKVTYARLHDIKVVHPKVGQLDYNIPSNSKAYPGLEMWLEDGVLDITIAGITSGIPTSNVQYMQFAAADAPKPEAAKITPKA